MGTRLGTIIVTNKVLIHDNYTVGLTNKFEKQYILLKMIDIHKLYIIVGRPMRYPVAILLIIGKYTK